MMGDLSGLRETTRRREVGLEEAREEIAMVLRLRRRWYGRGLAVLVLIVFGTALAISWSAPGAMPVALTWAASAILGTAAIVLVGYYAGKSALYEKAGRNLLERR